MPLEAPVITTVLSHYRRACMQILGHMNRYRMEFQTGTVGQYEGKVFNRASDTVGEYRVA